MTKALLGIVKNLQAAEQLITHLRSAGIQKEEIAILFNNKAQQSSKNQTPPHEENNWRNTESRQPNAQREQKQPQMGGSMPSGVIGSLPNITTINIPNIGSFIAAGKILTALNSKKSGQDPLTAALQSLNITDQEAHRLIERIKDKNGILIILTASAEELEEARSTFERNQATDIIQSRELTSTGGKKGRA